MSRFGNVYFYKSIRFKSVRFYVGRTYKIEKIYKFIRKKYGFFCGFLLKLGEGIEKWMDVRGIVCRFCIIYRKNGRIMRIREGAGK